MRFAIVLFLLLVGVMSANIFAGGTDQQKVDFVSAFDKYPNFITN